MVKKAYKDVVEKNSGDLPCVTVVFDRLPDNPALKDNYGLKDASLIDIYITAVSWHDNSVSLFYDIADNPAWYNGGNELVDIE